MNNEDEIGCLIFMVMIALGCGVAINAIGLIAEIIKLLT